MTESKGSRGLTVKVDVDVSEALTGLKALQREAKKAMQVLKELESQMERLNESRPIRSYTVGDVSSLEIGDDTREGSVIHYIAKELGITPSDLLALEPAEIKFLLTSIKSK